MHLRMHLLSRLRREKAWRRLSKLRWKLRAAADPAGGNAQEESAFTPADFQSEELRQYGIDTSRYRVISPPRPARETLDVFASTAR
jgi:hypothetical protein